MATIANLRSDDSSHWYSKDGKPQHTVMGKTTGKPRPTTIKDARKEGWLPSVTNILRCLHKEGLVRWKIEQAILTAMTAPRLTVEGVLESDDQYVERVFQLEKQHEQEGKKAADLGTKLHDAIAEYWKGHPIPQHYKPYLEPAMLELAKFGFPRHVEQVVVGNGYAGTKDIEFLTTELITVLDYKSTKTLPTKESWLEHRLQTSAYAKTVPNVGTARIQTANLYISTTEIGKYALFVQDDWLETYEKGFKPVLDYWSWANKYWPKL